MDSKKDLLRPLLVFLVIVFIDYFTKEIFQGKYEVIARNLLEINYVQNFGLIYGMYQNNFFLTVIFPFLLLMTFLYVFGFKNRSKKFLVPLSMVSAGIVGNLISRLKYGYVIDFIYIPILQPVFPNFNIADLSAFLGAIILLVLLLRKN